MFEDSIHKFGYANDPFLLECLVDLLILNEQIPNALYHLIQWDTAGFFTSLSRVRCEAKI